MLTALALAAVLGGTPAQPGALKLTGVRATIGELGPTRDATKVMPGDVLFIAYDVEGLTIDAEGMANYTMLLEVTNSTGLRILPPANEKAEPRALSDFVPLRGNKMPARAYITVGLDQPAGTYTCKVTVADQKTKASASLEYKFEVLKKDFGIVAVYTSHDAKGELSAPTTGQVGQTVFIQFSIASFERDPKTKQPDVEFEFQIVDDKGAGTLPTARKHIQDAKSAQQVPDGAGAFALQFPLFMSRAGKFTVEMKATDRVSKKTSIYKLPVTISPANQRLRRADAAVAAPAARPKEEARDRGTPMRISFDLDDTLVCYHPGAQYEPDRVRWWLRPWIYEPLRFGAVELLTELAREHELWVYTTSYRSPRTIAWWLWCYGARVRYVVNQDRHERAFGRSGRSKDPAAFGIDLHIDDSWGVWAENRFERNVCVVLPGDPDWAEKIRDAVARVLRREAPAEPPDLPAEYRIGR